MEFRHIFQRITKVLRITETIIEYYFFRKFSSGQGFLKSRLFCSSLPKQKHPLRVFLFWPEKAAGFECDRARLCRKRLTDVRLKEERIMNRK